MGLGGGEDKKLGESRLLLVVLDVDINQGGSLSLYDNIEDELAP